MMEEMDFLTTSLLDLIHELRAQGIPLTIGGGFGLFLKLGAIRASGEQTLLRAFPEVRSTNDIDLFLRAEIAADRAQFEAIREAIGRLDYKPFEAAKFMQWKRDMSGEWAPIPREVKLDLLVGPIAGFEDRVHRKAGSSRIRPKGKSIELHAHSTEEALAIDEDPVPVSIEGRRSDGESATATAYVPQMFPYLMMKLHAFNDRKDDGRKDLGSHHALDLYTIVALATQSEYIRAIELGREYRDDDRVKNARRIIKESFSADTSIGILRIREHRLFRREFPIRDFIEILGEIFPD
jgi:hypothetical protein